MHPNFFLFSLRDPYHVTIHPTHPLPSPFAGHDLNLEDRVGSRTYQVGDQEENKDKAGYYCKLCDANFKDSGSYVSHINGKKHQKMKGVSMRVEKVGADKVRDKLRALKEAKDKDEAAHHLDIEMRTAKRIKDQEAKETAQKHARREAKKRKRDEEDTRESTEMNTDEAMMKAMGFGSFK